VELRNDYARFQSAGLTIIAIGQGSVARTKAFREQLELPFPLLADPRRLAYTAYNLLNMDLRREAALGGIEGLTRGVKAAFTHGIAASPDQDMRQLGGVFVVGQDGLIRFAHRANFVSDHPTHDAILAAANL
jgi:peroxiredoxin